MRTKKVFLATQTGVGIEERYLFLQGNAIVGVGDCPERMFWEYKPPADLQDVLCGDWRLANYCFTKKEAKDLYIAQQRAKLAKATEALKMI